MAAENRFSLISVDFFRHYHLSAAKSAKSAKSAKLAKPAESAKSAK